MLFLYKNYLFVFLFEIPEPYSHFRFWPDVTSTERKFTIQRSRNWKQRDIDIVRTRKRVAFRMHCLLLSVFHDLLFCCQYNCCGNDMRLFPFVTSFSRYTTEFVEYLTYYYMYINNIYTLCACSMGVCSDLSCFSCVSIAIFKCIYLKRKRSMWLFPRHLDILIC